MQPHYALAVVRAAAAAGRVSLDSSRADSMLPTHLRTGQEAYAFAAAAVQALQAGDFCSSAELGPPYAGIYDVYGVRLADELLQRFGVWPRCWYLKLKLQESFEGESLFLISFHELERPMQRVGGLLVPERRGP